jgi:hypothetical protein
MSTTTKKKVKKTENVEIKKSEENTEDVDEFQLDTSKKKKVETAETKILKDITKNAVKTYLK